jgi:RimJ/RimL family protein N-acetyltransferase
MSDQGVGGPIIRDCRQQDVEAVLELWRQCGATLSITDTPADLRPLVAAEPAKALVAEVGGRLVGSIIGTFDGWRGNIYRLAVHPDYRRQGIARALTTEVERRFADQSVRRITALVEKENSAAMTFWEALGYRVDERIVRRVRTISPTPALDSLRCYAVLNLRVNDRAHLTEIRPSDKAALLEHFEDKEIYDFTLRIPFPYRETDAEEWLALNERTTRQQGRPVNWAIRNEAGYLIGAIGFHDLALGKSHRAEIGYWLAKPFWGQGLMTAVVKKACDFAFAEWDLGKITALVFAHNSGSARVLEKCGFEQEGYLKKHYMKDGRFLDARAYGLVR